MIFSLVYPLLASFPLGKNNTSNLSVRFEGELSTDAVTDWFATTVLELPRVFYHTKETLVYIISFHAIAEVRNWSRMK